MPTNMLPACPFPNPALRLRAQGSAADVAKRAMLALHARLPSQDACLVNMVHDELLLEVRADRLQRVRSGEGSKAGVTAVYNFCGCARCTQVLLVRNSPVLCQLPCSRPLPCSGLRPYPHRWPPWCATSWRVLPPR